MLVLGCIWFVIEKSCSIIALGLPDMYFESSINKNLQGWVSTRDPFPYIVHKMSGHYARIEFRMLCRVLAITPSRYLWHGGLLPYRTVTAVSAYRSVSIKSTYRGGQLPHRAATVTSRYRSFYCRDLQISARGKWIKHFIANTTI